MTISEEKEKSRVMEKKKRMSSWDVNVSESWVVSIQNELQIQDTKNPSSEFDHWSKPSIYKVPTSIKELNDKTYKAYRPQVVSFGPYHYGKEHLQPMEEHKHRALLHFLKRAHKPLLEFVKEMEGVVQQLQDSYQSLDEEWKSDRDRFLKLMITDGCFMLEILHAYSGEKLDDYAANDPIFSPHGMIYMVPHMRRDMLMLENQLPLLVLERLVTVQTSKPPTEDQINKLVLGLFGFKPQASSGGLGLHAIDLFRKSQIQCPNARSKESSSQQNAEENFTIRSAVELREAGIKFRKSKTRCINDIKFEHGELSLPKIVADDATEHMFLNLLAYERLHVGVGNEVTSYIFFMDNIINSAVDVSLLSKNKIIQNVMGSDEAVADLFNSLSKDVPLDPMSSLGAVSREVNTYCAKKRHIYCAILKHTHFANPLTVIALIAATILLLLAMAQTAYAILAYHHPKK